MIIIINNNDYHYQYVAFSTIKCIPFILFKLYSCINLQSLIMVNKTKSVIVSDVKINGNADELVDLFNMNDVKVFANSNEEYGAGRIGYIETIAADKFLELVEKKLNTKIIRTNAYFQKIKEITKLAILPGSGTQFIDEVINEADVFLTGDISHRYFLLADDNKLGLGQINHISTEIPGMRTFKNKIANELNIKVEYFYNKNYE